MKLLFGGFIAVMILILYVYAIYEALMVVMCVSTSSCTRFAAENFTPGFCHAMSLVGGLVSALVITEVAVTGAGCASNRRRDCRSDTELDAHDRDRDLSGGVGVCRFGGVCGRNHVVSGKLQPLADLGQSWLGLAVAAAYSYFGISPIGASSPPGTAQNSGPAHSGLRRDNTGCVRSGMRQ
jgi:hypothetical protein